MKRILTGALVTVCLLGLLTACGQKKTDAEKEPDAQDTTAQEQTVQGVVNRVGDYLVLLDGDEYRIFDFGEGVDSSALEEGDRVAVTYTGELGSEDPAPVAVSIEKAE